MNEKGRSGPPPNWRDHIWWRRHDQDRDPEWYLERLKAAHGPGVERMTFYNAGVYRSRPHLWRQLVEDAETDPIKWDIVQALLEGLRDRGSDEWQDSPLAGWAVDVALGRRHRPHGNAGPKHESRDRDILSTIAALRDLCGVRVLRDAGWNISGGRTRPRKQRQDACSMVAEALGLSYDTVFDIWKLHRRHYPPGVTKLR